AGPPYIRFHAAAPITSASGHRLGAFCLFDTSPRRLTIEERWALRDFAHSVEDEIAVPGRKDRRIARAPVDRRAGLAARWRQTDDQRERIKIQNILDQIIDGILVVDHEANIESLNRAALNMFGYKQHE